MSIVYGQWSMVYGSTVDSPRWLWTLEFTNLSTIATIDYRDYRLSTMDYRLKQPITTITFFKLHEKFWGFKQVGLAGKQLAKTPGLLFFRMLGSGAGLGFSLIPDFSVYALLAVWENEAQARHFHGEGAFMQTYKSHCTTYWTIYLKTLRSHGQWAGTNPFQADNEHKPDYCGPIAVITRATIRKKKLISFWRHVPGVSAALQGQPGLIFSKGIGEVPLLQQATFSLWQSVKDMQGYAYKDVRHKQVIEHTRKFNWYKEELFAQFIPFSSNGHWEGSERLVDCLKDVEG